MAQFHIFLIFSFYMIEHKMFLASMAIHILHVNKPSLSVTLPITVYMIHGVSGVDGGIKYLCTLDQDVLNKRLRFCTDSSQT